MRYQQGAVIMSMALTVCAQSIPDLEASLPSCATSCLHDAMKASGCAVSDYACLCSPGLTGYLNATKFSEKAVPCLHTISPCDYDQIVSLGKIEEQICAVAAKPTATVSASSKTSQTIQETTKATYTGAMPTPTEALEDDNIPSTESTTTTIYVTTTSTVAACNSVPTVSDCPAGLLSTEIVSTFTALCAIPTGASQITSTASAGSDSVQPSAPNAPLTSDMIPTTSAGNGLPSTSAAKAIPTTSAGKIVPTPPVSPISGATTVEVGGFLGFVVAVIALVL